MKPFVRILVTLGLAGVLATPALAAPKAKPAGKAGKPAPAVQASPAAGLPGGPAVARELDGQTVYQVLLAELALQRGAAEIAAAAYGQAALRTGDGGLLLRAIQVASVARQLDLGLQLARRWVEVEPTNRHARQALTGILAGLGRNDELLPQLRLLLADGDAEARARMLVNLHRYFGAQPDRQKVLAMVRELVAPYGQEAEASYAVATAAAAAGEREAALAAAREARKRKPDWAMPVLLEVQILGREGSAEAIATLRSALATQPGSADLRLHLARLLATEKRWEESRQEFERLLKDNPDAVEVLYATALVALQQSDLEAAGRFFEQLLETDFADRALVHYQLGGIAEEQRQYESAIAHYQQVTGGEYQVAAQTRRAQVLGKLGRSAEAHQALREIPTGNPQDRLRVVLAEAQLYRQEGDYKSAFEILEKALVGQPDDPDLLYDQAMIAERLSRMDVLEANLNRVIALRPDSAHAYNALGYSLADRNVRLDEARQLVGKALELAPDDPFILDSMGWVLYRLGQPKEAIVYLERAYGQRQDPEIAAHLGEVMWSIGRRDEARRLWGAAREQHPDNEVLRLTIRNHQP